MTSPDRPHIYIAGFMGTGKSAVGTALAERLGLPFVDLDEVIVRQQGRPIVDIFHDEGEAAFRRYESIALELTAAGPRAAIALGGGTPIIATNVATIRATGHTILLTADWRTTWERVRHDRARPLLRPIFADTEDVPDLEAFIAHAEPILQGRWDAYQAVADMTLDTSRQSVGDAVDRIAAWLTREKGC
ncbi:MAG TPA: shikimate kinase [Acidobacteriota bacterium]|nr:shikimate kinase [Acidobacteriota bacterium]